MKFDVNNFVRGIIVFVAIFIFSFVEYNNVNFLLSYPLTMVLLLYDEKFYFVGVLAMILSAFIIDSKYDVLSLIFGVVSTIAIFYVLRNRKKALCLAPVVSSVLFGLFHSVLLNKDSYTVLLVALLFGLFGYFLSKIYLKMKFKVEKTITYGEFLVASLLLSFILLNSSVSIFSSVDIDLILVCLLSYVIIKVHTSTGILCCFCNSFFYSFSGKVIPQVLILMTLLFIVPKIKKHPKTGAVLYLSVLLVASALLKNYSYLNEAIIFAGLVIFINPNIFVKAQKYIVDSKDYKIREYKERYNILLNKNQNIEYLINVVEEKIKSNNKMRKKYSDKILHNLTFLMNKVRQEPQQSSKDLIMADLEVMDLEVIGLRVIKSYQGNYKIDIEIRNFDDYNKLICCFERIIKKNFILVSGKYNFLTNVTKYTFQNKENYKFDYYIKQRSFDTKCGDNYMCFETENKKYFLVSDGMGHGKKADEDSKFALMLLRKLIELGMGASDAIEACNALVFSKDDTYNTLDLLEYDSYLNELVLYKNGSGNSYVLYKDNVDKLNSESLPLGIVDEISVNKILINNSVEKIILTSDGINVNVSSIIKENSKKTLKEMVEQIFIQQKTIEDDQTIMAISVIKN